MEWTSVKKRLPEKERAGGLFSHPALTQGEETGGHGSGSEESWSELNSLGLVSTDTQGHS